MPAVCAVHLPRAPRCCLRKTHPLPGAWQPSCEPHVMNCHGILLAQGSLICCNLDVMSCDWEVTACDATAPEEICRERALFRRQGAAHLQPETATVGWFCSLILQLIKSVPSVPQPACVSLSVSPSLQLSSALLHVLPCPALPMLLAPCFLCCLCTLSGHSALQESPSSKVDGVSGNDVPPPSSANGLSSSLIHAVKSSEVTWKGTEYFAGPARGRMP